jgi:hypothetical protein
VESDRYYNLRRGGWFLPTVPALHIKIPDKKRTLFLKHFVP